MTSMHKSVFLLLFLLSGGASSSLWAMDGYYYSYPILEKPTNPNWWKQVKGGSLKPPPVNDIDGLVEPNLFAKHWQVLCSEAGPDYDLSQVKGYAGRFVLVADHYHDAGYKCYRTHGNEKIILQREGRYFRFIAPIQFITESKKLLHDNEYHFALYDFLSSDVHTDVTLYWGAFDMANEFYAFIIKNEHGLSGVDFDSSHWRYVFFDLLPEKIEGRFLRKNTRDTYQTTDANRQKKGSAIEDGSRYLLMENAALNIFSPAESEGLPLTAYPYWKKAGFVPPYEDAGQNLVALTNFLGQSLTRLSGEKSPWVRRWITGSGLLTLNNGRTLKTSNFQRLKTWLKRYLDKQRVTLSKGKEYYFTQDLADYLLMNDPQKK